MESRCFDVKLEGEEGKSFGPQALLIHSGHKLGADLHHYEPPGRFLQIRPDRPLDIFWGDKLELRAPGARASGLRCTVLDPAAPRISRRVKARRIEALETLSGGGKKMLLALTESKGVKGLTDVEIQEFAALSEKTRIGWAQELEAEGLVKILSFEPLFLLAESSFRFLCEKIRAYIDRQHRDKPNLMGITLKSLRARFRIPERVNLLALKALQKGELISWQGDRVFPAGFRIEALPEDEKLLAELEELSLKGEFKRISLEEIRKRLRISSDRLNRLLALLIEREKVIQGRDGFLLHAQWLDEVVGKLRNWDRSEISIAEFKDLTGLSRKYAIPLLELLDQLGVTRRIGSRREIL
jgi:selenocysteine-specific elongation factor